MSAKMPKLNPNAQKWVDALRSGKYKQCQGRLGDDASGFCCLGVAGKISGIAFDPFSGNLDHKEKAIKDWLGLNNGWGNYGESSLTNDNDSGASFNQIADIIEEHAVELGVSA